MSLLLELIPVITILIIVAGIVYVNCIMDSDEDDVT